MTAKVFIYLLTGFSLFHFAASQSVLVNEYFNAADQDDEWTELIVTEAGLDLRGYSLRDNSNQGGTPSAWQGGVRFTDNPLWQGLRSGTIILIHHRGNSEEDVDKSDGYIELGAENLTYFEKRCWSCDLLNWDLSALSIAKETDILQVLDANDNHVHMLGHMLSESGDFVTINGPKSAYSGTIETNYSVRIFPGSKIEEYNVGFDGTGAWVKASDSYVTKGAPNRNDGFLLHNEDFIRELRDPVWNNPTLTGTKESNGIKLKWSRALDLIGDANQGYIILRLPKGEVGNFILPGDGEDYSPGDFLGPSLVVANIRNPMVSGFLDEYETECGVTYSYRMFVYQYRNEGTGTKYRGPSYNQIVYPEFTITDQLDIDFKIFTTDGRDTYCDGELIYLTIDPPWDDDYYVVWFREGSQRAGSEETKKDTLPEPLIFNDIQRDTIHYRAQLIRRSDGCYVFSNNLEIKLIRDPDAKIFNEQNFEFINDTTIYLCRDEFYQLEGKGRGTLIWQKDGTDFMRDESNLLLSEEDEATYRLIANVDDICSDTTANVTFKFIDVDYRFANLVNDTLRMYIQKGQTFNDRNVDIQNFSSDTLIIYKNNIVYNPPGIEGSFQIISPVFPIIVPPAQIVPITVRFFMLFDGNLSGDMIFNTICMQDTVHLKGTKTNLDVASAYIEPDSLDFKKTTCRGTNAELAEIILTGSAEFRFFEPIDATPFAPSYNNISNGDIVDNNQTVILNVEFIESTPGVYYDTVCIPIEIIQGAITTPDTLKLKVRGEVLANMFTLRNDSLEFVLSECKQSVDSLIAITNDNFETITVSLEGPADPRIIFNTPLPLEIESMETDTIRYTYQPADVKDTLEFKLKITPCPEYPPIKLYAEKSSRDLKITTLDGTVADTIKFGVLPTCGSDLISLDTTLQFVCKGDKGELPRIEEITIGPDVTSSITVGHVFTKEIEALNIKLTGLGQGPFEKIVLYRINPCDQEIKLVITGTIEKYDISMSPSSDIDFGTHIAFANEQKKLTISNLNSFEHVIEFVDLESPFSLVDPAPAEFPVTIPPFTDSVFTFLYYRTSPSIDTLPIRMFETKMCDGTLNYPVVLTGRVDQAPGFDAQLDIPANLSSVVGQEFVLPVFLSGVDGYVMGEGVVTHADFTLEYDWTVLEARDVQFSDALQNADAQGLEFNEQANGILNISFDVFNGRNAENGRWLDVRFLGLSGPEKITIIRGDAIIDSYNSIEVLPDSGLIEVSGECLEDERSVTITQSFSFTYSLNGNILKIKFFSPVDGEIEIGLYNIYGEMNELISKENISPGNYEVIADVSGLPAGVYFIMFKNGNRLKNSKILITR